MLYRFSTYTMEPGRLPNTQITNWIGSISSLREGGKLTLQDKDRAAMRRLGLDMHPNIRSVSLYLSDFEISGNNRDILIFVLF